MTTKTTTKNCPTSQSLNDWLFYLESQHPAEIELGLQRVEKVAQAAAVTDFGKTKLVLVAGTNGKGTTIRFMEQYLLAAGHSVGIYSSPHMTRYNERVRINDKQLDDEIHVEAFQHIERARAETPLTYFEFGTLAAFYLLQQAKLDYVLIEVGLGGRLDATNILPHDVSVVTSLGLDHTDWLGDTIEQIGFEKAGIFRQGKPAVVGLNNPPETVFKQANDLGVANLVVAGRDYNLENTQGTWRVSTVKSEFTELPMPLIPQMNIATALNTLEQLGVSLQADLVHKMCLEVTLAGRMQVLSNAPMTMVDVGHNPHAIEYLVTTLQTHSRFKSVAKIDVVFSMMADKDIQATIAALKPLVRHWHIAPLVGNPRAATLSQMRECFINLGIHSVSEYETISTAWHSAQVKINADDLLLGVGSFYTVAEVLSCYDVEQ